MSAVGDVHVHWRKGGGILASRVNRTASVSAVHPKPGTAGERAGWLAGQGWRVGCPLHSRSSLLHSYSSLLHSYSSFLSELLSAGLAAE